MGYRYPPGPTNFNAWCGLTCRHAWQLWSDAPGFVTEMERRFGDVVFYRLFIHPTYQVNHPDLIRDVLVTKAKSFIKQRRHMRFVRQVAGDSVLTTEGEAWQRLRQLMLPAFQSHAGHQMAEIGVAHVERMMDAWQPNQVISLHDEMIELMVRTAGESLLGVSNEALAASLGRAMHVISQALLEQIASIARLPGWVPGSSHWRLKRANAFASAVVDDAIQLRRAQPRRTRDLLDLLMTATDLEGNGHGLTSEQVRAEAVTMYFAGHHTAASCLTWTLLLLAENPQVEARLIEEIDDALDGRTPTPNDLPRLAYTERVLKESMRIYPPAWSLFSREAVEDVEIGGYTIPRGAWVFIYPWVVQRSPRFFADPLRFDPDRFAPERADEIPTGAYIPFGLGGHACIGSRMAMTTVSLVLSALLQRFQFRPLGSAEPRRMEPLISLRPKDRIGTIVTPQQRLRS